MKHLLDVYPYDVHIALPDATTNYQSAEYGDRVEEAMLWLDSMGIKAEQHWKIRGASGSDGVSLEFKRNKDALLFKIAFG